MLNVYLLLAIYKVYMNDMKTSIIILIMGVLFSFIQWNDDDSAD